MKYPTIRYNCHTQRILFMCNCERTISIPGFAMVSEVCECGITWYFDCSTGNLFLQYPNKILWTDMKFFDSFDSSI